METKVSSKWHKNKKLGDKRERRVAEYLLAQGYEVNFSSFLADVEFGIDLIATKPNERHKYIQVKGFHADHKDDNFNIMIDKARENNAIPLIARVNKIGRIYWYKAVKKKEPIN